MGRKARGRDRDRETYRKRGCAHASLEAYKLHWVAVIASDIAANDPARAVQISLPLFCATFLTPGKCKKDGYRAPLEFGQFER